MIKLSHNPLKNPSMALTSERIVSTDYLLNSKKIC